VQFLARGKFSGFARRRNDSTNGKDLYFSLQWEKEEHKLWLTLYGIKDFNFFSSQFRDVRREIKLTSTSMSTVVHSQIHAELEERRGSTVSELHQKFAKI